MKKLLQKAPWGFLTTLAIGLALIALFQEPLFGDKIGGTDVGGPSGRVTTWTEAIGAKTATFTTDGYDVKEAQRIVFTLDVTAASGTSPTCDCTIESSTDNANWYTTGTAFTQATGVTSETKSITNGAFHRSVRANCVIAGTTPSFTTSFYLTGRP